jgi:hypothetical protein
MLVGSLAVKARTADILASRNLEPAVTLVAGLNGLTLRGYTTIPHTDIRAQAFTACGCARPVIIASLLATFDQEPIVRTGREEDYLLRYVYIDSTWDKPHPLSVVVERVKYAALATFGLTRYAPSPQLLLIQFPSRCQVVNAIDWRDVWNRDSDKSKSSPPL